MSARIGLLPGDPSGIGPEIVARLLSEDIVEGANVLLIGDQHVFELGQAQAEISHPLTPLDATQGDWTGADRFALHRMETIVPGELIVAQNTEVSGRSTLRVLDEALRLSQKGVIDAVVFAPFNKASMHMAGIGHSGELHYIADLLGVRGHVSELNTADGLWTGRVTSHIALREVANHIDADGIRKSVRLIDRTLRRAGYAHPRIAVAALNPHAGDGGNFGREEIDVIAPVVRELAAEKLAVEGPLPSDTVFLKAQRGEIDAVVTMYHDQGQIALKLLGFDRGVTVHGGLPLPLTTPAHGSAFDIAGKGRADVGAIRAAFAVARDLVSN
ncbi:4-hydroxythreonine-4-phosphate dehydrogenase PdxA [Chelativorans sp. M5D2P16]|uniref:4-hydroxythreonine-4-phosphate dehydrogenase PdxA n=1 Tax=Chelativorans sp. M5D2P16 TaxID=3095678 RepID=UPI002ACA83BE|nr:4-hydroxythreonine-4-phosphate dehydrogenase PdxA [Chelativorans sp. M5D2P16]MDZ5696647.1 4-hydroxythreonine-4-phosphate dehydrogenase PdxA [Chelativorans sp. M5D2P16]